MTAKGTESLFSRNMLSLYPFSGIAVTVKSLRLCRQDFMFSALSGRML